MAVALNKYKIVYLPVPKVACTSVKEYFFALENGFDFPEMFVNGRRVVVHNIGLQTSLFDGFPKEAYEDYFRFTVIRDPIRRLLSVYSNRVLAANQLSPKWVKGSGLAPRPDLTTFLENFEAYRAASSPIAHHSRPQTDFVGSDPGYFSNVYDVGQLSLLEAEINRRVGLNWKIPRSNANSKKFSPDDVPKHLIGKIQEFYRTDYDFIEKAGLLN